MFHDSHLATLARQNDLRDTIDVTSTATFDHLPETRADSVANCSSPFALSYDTETLPSDNKPDREDGEDLKFQGFQEDEEDEKLTRNLENSLEA